MVNTDDFIKRLEILMEHFGMNASSFADKIGVQRSSISHLLSGRNKPSLDFVMKISDIFPDVNLYWILNGKGNLLKDEIDSKEAFSQKNDSEHISSFNADLSKKENIEEQPETVFSKMDTSSFDTLKSNSEIFKIVFFYRDGTFKDFNP